MGFKYSSWGGSLLLWVNIIWLITLLYLVEHVNSKSNSWDLFQHKYTFNYDFNNFVSFYNELFNQNQNQGMETMILIIHFYTV